MANTHMVNFNCGAKSFSLTCKSQNLQWMLSNQDKIPFCPDQEILPEMDPRGYRSFVVLNFAPQMKLAFMEPL